MTKPFKPLLADPVEFEHLDYGNLWLSPKLDGIRAIIIDGVVKSRKLLDIPNKHVQKIFGGRPAIEYFDGELIVGEPNDDPYGRTYSGTMSIDGEPDVRFYVFDHIESPNDEYWKRLNRVGNNDYGVIKVPQHPVTCLDDILELEEKYLAEGYEGVMLRAFQGPRSFYKFGRSTAKQGTLLKLKRYTDFEARIVGIEEEMHNGNEATTDNLGRTKRSSHAENKTGKGTLGKINCVDLETGIDFNCGIFKGFDAAWKKKMWEDPSQIIGKIAKLQKFGPGEKDRPRHPKFIGFRSPIDM